MARQTLTREGRRVRVPRRALDLLLALAERAGETVGHRELATRVWPNRSIGGSVLRVHIGTLRKALDDRASAVRYVDNVNGMGYRLLAPQGSHDEPPRYEGSTAGRLAEDLIPAPTQLVGRDEALSDLTTRLRHTRLVSIVGAPGVGKTCAAIATAHGLRSANFSGRYFVDLASLEDPAILCASIASALGLSDTGADAMPRILELIGQHRVLLVLDNCEHLISPVAELVDKLLAQAPHLRILTTSRQPLRVSGESVLRLPPLDLPTSSVALTAERARTFSAVKLFTDLAAQNLPDLRFTAADVPGIVSICRNLDGLPLAIELAVARLNVLGLRGLTEQLGKQMTLLTMGNRTAPERHRTLRAALDWSCQSLTSVEQTALRHLAIFTDGFDIGSVAATLSGTAAETGDSLEIVTALADKSLLIISSVSKDEIVFRMLQTTRAYALEKLGASEERALSPSQQQPLLRRRTAT
jgi:predicted ATPase/DNA-binding winged helix-turn-helix (wHTH) protein